jgi:hypothetical protein
MSFKTLPFLIILLFSSVILSCMEENCREALPYFEVEGLDVFPISNESELPITTSNPIEWNKFVYLVGFRISGIAQNNSTSSGNLLALDCTTDGYLGSKIGIESLIIRPLTDYSDIDNPDSFSASLYRLEVINELISPQEFNLIFKEGFSFQKFNIRLNRAPEMGGEIQKFEIELTFTNGKKLIQTTPELRILR